MGCDLSSCQLCFKTFRIAIDTLKESSGNAMMAVSGAVIIVVALILLPNGVLTIATSVQDMQYSSTLGLSIDEALSLDPATKETKRVGRLHRAGKAFRRRVDAPARIRPMACQVFSLVGCSAST